MTRAASWVVVCLVLLASAGERARAQRVESSIDFGGASTRFADSLRVSSAVITPAVRLQWERASLGLAGTFSGLNAQGWTTQLSGSASLFTPAAGPFTGELSAVGGGSAHQDGSRTTQLLGTARAHLMAGTGGAWLGAGAGQMSDGIVWRGVRLAEAGGWLRVGSGVVAVTATPTVVADTIRYSDTQASLSLSGARTDLSATVGTRAGSHVPAIGGSATSWGSASLAFWFTPRAALVVGGGTYPVDLTQGFPGGRFITMSLRIRSAPPAVAVPDVATAPSSDARGAAPGATDFRLAPAAGSGPRTIRVRASSATRVELMGDFTEWRPVALRAAGDGWWQAELPIAPGIHQVNVRVDGGAWRAPPGVETMSDEFGGVVGVLIVPGAK